MLEFFRERLNKERNSFFLLFANRDRVYDPSLLLQRLLVRRANHSEEEGYTFNYYRFYV